MPIEHLNNGENGLSARTKLSDPSQERNAVRPHMWADEGAWDDDHPVFSDEPGDGSEAENHD